MLDLRKSMNVWLNRVRDAANLPKNPAQDISDPHQFEDSEHGSGHFGKWMLDDAGLPAYDYQLNQYADSNANYPNSENLNRRDHWHQFGNNRITALASNDGLVQAYIADRGGMFLNHYDPDMEYNAWQALMTVLRIMVQGTGNILRNRQLDDKQRRASAPGAGEMFEAYQAVQQARRDANDSHTYVGGYAYIDDGQEKWSTAFAYAPPTATTKRIFGMGYFETHTAFNGLNVKRRTYAPPGNDAVFIVDVTLTNTGDTAKSLRYYEYWDINVYQLKLQWIRAGAFVPIMDAERRRLNSAFIKHIRYIPEDKALRFNQQAKEDDIPAPDEISDVNWYPADVFLADLSGTPDDSYDLKEDFFGDGDHHLPEAVREQRGRDAAKRPRGTMPHCTVLRRDLTIEAGETITLRFAYGAVRPDESLDFLTPYRTGEHFNVMREDWKRRLAYFSIGSDPALQREMAWHAYSLLSSTIYNDYFGVNIPPQGSAYLYLHGADGVPRDYALYAMALAYIEPELAKNLLRVIMQMTDRDSKQIQYAVSGHGFLDGAGVHDHPSDLDLFFLLAMWEYLGATGDHAFMNEQVPFHPVGEAASQGFTVRDHVITALEHLMDSENGVGVGENGLIRMSDGDWSDGVVLENVLKFPPVVSFNNTLKHGESVMNSQMALFILPRIIPLIGDTHPDLAQRVQKFHADVEQATMKQWTGLWYTRAIVRGYFFNKSIVLHDKDINLESQPWALISDLAEKQGVVDTLIESIDTQLDRRSLIGAPLMAGGMVWPAVSQLLTWGYVRYRPDLAWRSFYRHTFIAHSQAFPHIWFNTWSGPDGINGTDDINYPGGTWGSAATPMTDFPITNNNPHSMALLAMLRVCGVEPTAKGDGLRIAPQKPERYRLDVTLIKLDVSPNSISGIYRPVADSTRKLYIAVPAAATPQVTLNGVEQAPTRANGDIVLAFTAQSGKAVTFSVTWD